MGKFFRKYFQPCVTGFGLISKRDTGNGEKSFKSAGIFASYGFMKKLSLLFAVFNLISLTGFAGQIGEFEVKSCSLIVSPTANDEVLSVLMAKGYRPMNLLGASKNPESAKDLIGFPYLEESSLNIKIVGETKTLYSIDEAPNCLDN